MLELKKRNKNYEDRQKETFKNLLDSNKPYSEIISFVKNEYDMSRKMSGFQHSIPCFREDGVYHLNESIKQIFGVTINKADRNPSDIEKIETLEINLADGTKISVPYGKIDLPDAGDDASINIGYNSDNNVLVVTGICEYRYGSLIAEIVELTKYKIKTNSIYSRQALELDSNFKPKLMNLDNIDNQLLILSERNVRDMKPLIARVTKPEICKENNIPLKTGILLEGPYGL